MRKPRIAEGDRAVGVLASKFDPHLLPAGQRDTQPGGFPLGQYLVRGIRVIVEDFVL
jgi:hypothetical protein